MMETLKTYQKTDVNVDKLTSEISNSGFIENYAGIFHDGETLTILGDSILDLNGLDNLVSNHTIIDDLKTEIEKYYIRQHDGKVAIVQLMAELRLNAIANNYPRIVNATIENAFWDVAIAINNGWWITAKEKCELVQVGGYITQDLYDRIHGKITAYIAENY